MADRGLTFLLYYACVCLLMPAGAQANGLVMQGQDNQTISTPVSGESTDADTGKGDATPLGNKTAEVPEDDRSDESEDFFDPFDIETSDQHAGTAQTAFSDPLRGYNHLIYRINDKFYFWFLKPFALGYGFVVPAPPRRCIKNLFHNLAMPVRFLNCLFQIKPKGAGVELSRFVVNTTVGLAGLFDPARAFLKLHPCEEDMGQTFGRYGSGPGFYFVLPFFGPSSGRDALGLSFDLALNPATYLPGSTLFVAVNNTSLSIGDYESLKEAALDPYVSLRNVYFQHRENAVKN